MTKPITAMTPVSAEPSKGPILRVENLVTSVIRDGTALPAVDGVSFTVRPGEILGVVGESGSGKSLTALSVMRMLPTGVRTTAGRIEFGGRDLLALPDSQMRAVRGQEIGMVFQDPLAFLNPRMSVGRQIAECAVVHGADRATALSRARELLELVGIPQAGSRLHDYPHQFSGGQRQRILIAMAMTNQPRLLIADEPTTALDATVQAGILQLIRELRDKTGTAVVIITHDMSIVEQVCDRVAVMYGGQIVELGSAKAVLSRPQHPYSDGLLRSVPRLRGAQVDRLPVIPGTPPDLAERPVGCPFAARCAYADHTCVERRPELTGDVDVQGYACWHPRTEPRASSGVADKTTSVASPQSGTAVLVAEDVTVRYGSRRRGRVAVRKVSLAAGPGRAIGIIGESGSGKSTLARALLGLLPVESGSVLVDDQRWDRARGSARLTLRRRVQMVFQDPYLSLNPRLPVRQTLSEPFAVHELCPPDAIPGELDRLMDLVRLPNRYLDQYPYQLSGGQRQRVGIARALAVGPQVIVADEPVSALDVSVQAQILNLLADLRQQTGVGLVFIAHDLGLVRYLCEETLVMHEGQVVEQGPTHQLFDSPSHPYTQSLVAAAH